MPSVKSEILFQVGRLRRLTLSWHVAGDDAVFGLKSDAAGAGAGADGAQAAGDTGLALNLLAQVPKEHPFTKATEALLESMQITIAFGEHDHQLISSCCLELASIYGKRWFADDKLNERHTHLACYYLQTAASVAEMGSKLNASIQLLTSEAMSDAVKGTLPVSCARFLEITAGR